jgi:hypothetical protein
VDALSLGLALSNEPLRFAPREAVDIVCKAYRAEPVRLQDREKIRFVYAKQTAQRMNAQQPIWQHGSSFLK